MARAAAKATLFAALLSGAGSSGAGDTELRQRVAELQQLLDGESERLDGVGRALQSSSGEPSLYGDRPNTRLYNYVESWIYAELHMSQLLFGFLVFFMQAGFSMLQAGACRVRSTQHVHLMTLVSVASTTLTWWILGYSFALTGPYNSDGKKKSMWAGKEHFAGHEFLSARDDGQQEPTTKIVEWFFSWAIACAATTITAGGVAERAYATGYSIYAVLYSAFIFPIVVGWTWGNGWLSDMNVPGYVDRAGSGIVHITGGMGALMGAIVVGPRIGRFDDLSAKERVLTDPEDSIPHNQPLMVLGTFILWFGFYGLHCGTSAIRSVETGYLAAQMAMNTTISASVSGITAFILRSAMKRRNDLDAMCYGTLAGIVSIAAGCGSVECGTAAGIGAGGAVFYVAFSALLKAAKVDDPVDAFPVHGACGMWGLFAASLMDWGQGVDRIHGMSGFRCVYDPSTGKCKDDWTPKMTGNLVASNMAEMFSIIAWSGFLSLLIFGILRVARVLKVSEDDQEHGLDKQRHTPPRAYNFAVSAKVGVSPIV